MNTNELLFSLRSRITPAERSTLRDNIVPHISRHNREMLLRMLNVYELPHMPVDTGRENAFHAALQDYPNRCMRETSEAHKWIILACLILALVAREPMHPKTIVGWEQVDGDYFAPRGRRMAYVNGAYAGDLDVQPPCFL